MRVDGAAQVTIIAADASADVHSTVASSVNDDDLFVTTRDIQCLHVAEVNRNWRAKIKRNVIQSIEVNQAPLLVYNLL